MSLRTYQRHAQVLRLLRRQELVVSDRRHWCDNPYPKSPDFFSIFRKERIATPVCALARNDRPSACALRPRIQIRAAKRHTILFHFSLFSFHCLSVPGRVARFLQAADDGIVGNGFHGSSSFRCGWCLVCLLLFGFARASVRLRRLTQSPVFRALLSFSGVRGTFRAVFDLVSSRSGGFCFVLSDFLVSKETARPLSASRVRPYYTTQQNFCQEEISSKVNFLFCVRKPPVFSAEPPFRSPPCLP